MDTYTASDLDIRAVDHNMLVDIRNVKVNTALPKRERILDFIRQIGNPYCYIDDGVVVKIGFMNTRETIDDRLEGYARSQVSKG